MEFLVAFVCFYLFHALSIASIWHRKLSHRSFKCPKWLEYVGVIGGYLAFQGSVVGWVTTHKIHHMTVDTEYDPHSPKTRGFWYAFIGWLFNRNLTMADMIKYSPELVADPFYRWLGYKTFPDKPLMNLFISLGFRGLLWVIFGWQIALASLLAGLLAFLAPQLVNTICHMPKFGYRNFPTNDVSTNVPWLILPLGEELHGNHHWKPRRASQSHKPWEIDITYGFILLLERLGLAWDVIR